MKDISCWDLESQSKSSAFKEEKSSCKINYKFKISNSKQIPITKIQNSKFNILNFEFMIYLGFGILDLVLEKIQTPKPIYLPFPFLFPIPRLFPLLLHKKPD